MRFLFLVPANKLTSLEVSQVHWGSQNPSWCFYEWAHNTGPSLWKPDEPERIQVLLPVYRWWWRRICMADPPWAAHRQITAPNPAHSAGWGTDWADGASPHACSSYGICRRTTEVEDDANTDSTGLNAFNVVLTFLARPESEQRCSSLRGDSHPSASCHGTCRSCICCAEEAVEQESQRGLLVYSVCAG